MKLVSVLTMLIVCSALLFVFTVSGWNYHPLKVGISLITGAVWFGLLWGDVTLQRDIAKLTH